MLNSQKSHFLQGSNFLNTIFIFSFSLIISIFTGGRSLYMIPLILSTTIIWINRHEIRTVKFRFDFHWIIFSISVFIFFFYHFVGFDFIGNEIHKDLIYYGALSDFLGKYHQETTDINIFNGIDQKSPWNIYHYFEIWISGIIGNTLKIPSIKVLILFTYPIFCIISFHNLRSFLESQKIKIQFSKLLLAIAVFFSLLSWLPNLFFFSPAIKSYISFNEFLSSGYVKLLIAIPLVINVLNYYSLLNKSITDHLIYFLVFFYYPTLIPFGIGLFIFVFFQKITCKSIPIKHLNTLLFAIFIGLSLFFTNVLQPLKMDIVRMGIPSIILIYLIFKNSIPYQFIQLYITIILFALSMHTTFIIGQKFLPQIKTLNHIDLFQTWSNFTTILSFFVFLILIILSINSLRFTINNRYLIIIAMIGFPMLISSGRLSRTYCIVDNHNLDSTDDAYFVVIDKLSSQKLNQWNSDWFYMLINEKHSQYVWENRNFFLINNMKISDSDTNQNFTFYKTEILNNQKHLSDVEFLNSNNLKQRIIVPLKININAL